MTPQVKRVYLDLDRTLIDTERIIKELFKATEKLYGFSATSLKQAMTNFWYAAGELKTYSFFEHMSSRGIGEAQLRKDMRKALAGQDFLFKDARPLLAFLKEHRYEAHIVTFGKTDYQKFKFELAPELKHLPLTIVFEQKDTYLSQQSTIPSLLVDDKRIEPLPSWCTLALIDRKAERKIVKESDQVVRIKTLNAVPTLLTVGYNKGSQKRSDR